MMKRTIICISRQYGSGGREIGEAVAKKLGIPCYDKCLIQKAAQEAGLSETAVAEYDEKGEAFGVAVSGNPFADTAALSEAFYSEEARVFDAERRVILELAEKGDCVIIGRCASAILHSAGYHPLSVFIYADSADRAKRIAARNGLDEKRALHKAQKVDRMRKHHFDFYADTLWGEPESYDLMLSSSAHQHTLALADLPASGKGILIGDRDNLVIDLGIQDGGDKPCADALDAMLTGDAGGKDGGSLRLDGDDADGRIFLPEVAAHTGDGTAGADPCHKGIHLPIGILPDLRGGGGVVGLGVGLIDKLAGDEAVRDLAREFIRFGDGAFHALGAGGDIIVS